MQAARVTLRRTVEQRVALLAFVFALVFAPALANVWPAFGKGEMLFVGDAVAAHADQAGHAAHQDAATESHHSESHHQQHCALCVLAFLGWAPPLDLSLGCTGTCGPDRAARVAETAAHPLFVWPGAQARAPPIS